MQRDALERAIVDDPDDLQAWIVYADWLQARGDPWGERVGLDLAHYQATGRLRSHLHDALAEHDRAMAPVLLGERLAALLERPGFAATIVLERRFGLVLGARIGRRWIVDVEHPENQRDREQAEQVLAALLSGTASRLLRSLTLGYCDLDRACATLIEAAPRTPLRRLGIGWEERNEAGVTQRVAEIGDISIVLEHLPELRELDLEGPAQGLEHPRIERLGVTVGGDQLATYEALAHAKLPALRTLELRLYGIPNGPTVDRLPTLLANLSQNPSCVGLEHLHVEGLLGRSRRQAGAAALLTTLARAPLLRRLRSIRLTRITFDARLVQTLLDSSDRLGQLEALELVEHGLSEELLEALQRGLGPIVRAQLEG